MKQSLVLQSGDLVRLPTMSRVGPERLRGPGIFLGPADDTIEERSMSIGYFSVGKRADESVGKGLEVRFMLKGAEHAVHAYTFRDDVFSGDIAFMFVLVGGSIEVVPYDRSNSLTRISRVAEATG